MSLLRVRSSNAAAPSVVRMKPMVFAMLVMFAGISIGSGVAPAFR